MPVHDRLREARRPRRVEDPERVVERHLRERQLLVSGPCEELVPAERVPEPADLRLGREVAEHDGVLERRHRLLEGAHDAEPVVIAAAVPVAVDGEEHTGLDLGEPVDDAPGAEIRRAARPDGAQARAGVERDDGLDDVRQVGDHTVAGADPERAQGGGEPSRRLVQLAPRRLGERPELGCVADRDRPGIAAAKDVLRVVQPRPREPLGPGHGTGAQHAFVGLRGPHVEVLPDRRPERLDLRHRPAPELVVAARLRAAGLRHPACVSRDRGTLDALLVGRPEDRWRAVHGSKPTGAPGTSSAK